MLHKNVHEACNQNNVICIGEFAMGLKWNTACIENGCEELCPLFCDVDNVTYGGLKKLDFSRTKTLGYGADCCDVHFYKK